LLIRSESRTVHDILRRIAKGSFVMDPDFQRDFIWPEDKQSKLVESVLQPFEGAMGERGKMQSSKELRVVHARRRRPFFRETQPFRLRIE
ncbi:MAG: hypothetical protein ACR2H9_13020, partial [Longimicrobiaceae bacterium]